MNLKTFLPIVNSTVGTQISNFIGNNATYYGGAVYFWDTGEVTNCNFTNNSASNRGGAVYFLNTGEVTNCNLPSTVNLKIKFYEKVSRFLKK